MNEHRTLDRVFNHHPPGNPGIAMTHEDIRRNCKELVERFRLICPNSIELTEAEKKVEEAMFWANAAIARNQ